MEQDNKISDDQLNTIQDYDGPLGKLLEKTAKNFPNQDIRYETLENNKVSDALRDFIEPYTDEVDGDKEFAMLLDLGILAWNLSFFSKKEAKREIDKLLQAQGIMSKDIDKADREDFKNMLGQMIARKKRHFSKYKRLIVDYELKDEQDRYHLFVMSMPLKKGY